MSKDTNCSVELLRSVVRSVLRSCWGTDIIGVLITDSDDLAKVSPPDEFTGAEGGLIGVLMSEGIASADVVWGCVF